MHSTKLSDSSKPACPSCRLAPAVRLTPEDEEALGTVRALLSLLQRLQGAGGAPAATASAGDASGPMAAATGLARAAGEVGPLLPELAPGLAHTAQLFARALVQR